MHPRAGIRRHHQGSVGICESTLSSGAALTRRTISSRSGIVSAKNRRSAFSSVVASRSQRMPTYQSGPRKSRCTQTALRASSARRTMSRAQRLMRSDLVTAMSPQNAVDQWGRDRFKMAVVPRVLNRIRVSARGQSRVMVFCLLRDVLKRPSAARRSGPRSTGRGPPPSRIPLSRARDGLVAVGAAREPRSRTDRRGAVRCVSRPGCGYRWR